MFRRDLITMLLAQPMRVGELAEALDLRQREMAGELEHLRRRLKNQPYRLEVIPARCRQCGFTFSSDKVTKPGKCPDAAAPGFMSPRDLLAVFDECSSLAGRIQFRSRENLLTIPGEAAPNAGIRF